MDGEVAEGEGERSEGDGNVEITRVVYGEKIEESSFHYSLLQGVFSCIF